MSLKSAAQPGVIAAVSSAWMGAGWTYYVRRGAGGGGRARGDGDDGGAGRVGGDRDGVGEQV
jgi:hypothetical protein